MIRISPIALLLAVSTAADAQKSSTKPQPGDSLKTRFVGTWEGKYTTDHGPGGAMQIVIANDTAWTVAIEMTMGDQVMPTLVRQIQVSGKTISWIQEIMGMACETKSTVDAAAMSGKGSCGHAGFAMELRRK